MTKLAQLVDSFPGSTLDSLKWTALNGLPTALVDNQAQIPESSGFPAMQSVLAYDFSNSFFHLKVVPPTLVTGNSVTLSVGPDNNNQMVIAVQGTNPGALLCRLLSNGSYTGTDVAVDYSSSLHAYWRLREAVGQLYWETSPFGQLWTVQRVALTPWPATACTVTITGGIGTPASGYGFGPYGSGNYGG